MAPRRRPLVSKPLSREEVEQLSDEQIRIMLARENLIRYGSVTPPAMKAPAALSVVVAQPKEKEGPLPEPDWTKVVRTCPQCEKDKKVMPDFGVTSVRGKRQAQSWCKKCRGEKNYHALPRSYNTRNGSKRR